MPRLKLKWAFGIPHGMTNNAQPTVVAGRVFMATDNGYIYSLDAKTGCVYWSFQNGSIVRNSPMVGAVKGQGGAQWAVFFGDGHANVFALDAQTGRQLWKVRVDDHVVARITGSVRYHDGVVYVPISGSEEFTAGHPDYPCCTARGGVAALDASTGKQIWKTYTADEPKPWKKNPNGVQLYGPADGGVWNAPTIDPVRGALYVGTGDAVTPPESRLSDAVMALDIKTGKVLWSRRATKDDLFMGGCAGPNKGEQCPSTMGPDYDIGNSPILTTLPNGKRALFVGTKGADVLALDPDANGAVLFRVNPSGQPVGFTGRGRGGIVWGGAADGRQRLLRHGRGRPRRGAERRRQDRVDLRPGARRAGRRADDDSRRGVRGGWRRPAVRRVGGRRQAAVGVQHRAAGRDRQQGHRARRPDRRLRCRHRRRHGLRRLGLRDQRRRLWRQRAAGVRCRVGFRRATFRWPFTRLAAPRSGLIPQRAAGRLRVTRAGSRRASRDVTAR